MLLFSYKFYSFSSSESIYDNLLKLKNLDVLKVGISGACKCTNIVDFISKLNEITKLSIEAPLRYHNIPCRQVPIEIESCLIDGLKQLKQLKELRLVNTCRTQADVLEVLGDNLKQLEELHIIGYRSLYQQKLLNYLKKAPELRVLNITNSKINLSVNIYNEIVRIIKNRGNDVPLTIYMTSLESGNMLLSPFVKVFRE